VIAPTHSILKSTFAGEVNPAGLEKLKVTKLWDSSRSLPRQTLQTIAQLGQSVLHNPDLSVYGNLLHTYDRISGHPGSLEARLLPNLEAAIKNSSPDEEIANPKIPEESGPQKAYQFALTRRGIRNQVKK